MQIKEVTYVPLDASLRRVFQAIPEEVLSFDEAREFAVDAMQELGVRYTYQERIAIMSIKNHRAWLPKGMKYIDQMMYKIEVTDEDLAAIDVVTNAGGTIATTQVDHLLVNQLRAEWYPMQASSSGWQLSVHCHDSINLTCDCDVTYRVETNGCITTSIESGVVLLLYYGHPQDENGNFLIPDDIDYNEAIKNYVLMCHHERRFNQHMEGSERRYRFYLNLWNRSQARVRGNMMMPSSDGLENLRRQLQRIGENNESWKKGFGNIATQERVFFTNPGSYLRY
jgi:hypothetical protein